MAVAGHSIVLQSSNIHFIPEYDLIVILSVISDLLGISKIVFLELRTVIFLFLVFFVQCFSSHDSALHRWSSIYVLGNIGY